MKIINIKFSFKIFIILVCIIIGLLTSILFVKLVTDRTISMNNSNYTYTLKKVHDNPNMYFNKKIIMNGYMFRADDFAKNQFVVARDMIVSDKDYRIVGFLCEYDENKIKKFENNVWIEIKGVITLGDYHGPMPIIKVAQIKRIDTPNDVVVYPPKDKQ